MSEGAAKGSGRPRHPRLAAVFALLLLAHVMAGVYAYIRFVYYPTTPQYALDQFFEAVKSRDYERIYGLVYATGPLKMLIPDAGHLRALAEQFPPMIFRVEDHQLGNATVTGDKAIVNTSVTADIRGRRAASTVAVHLLRRNGVWKIDGSWVFSEAVGHGLGEMLLQEGGP